MLAGLVSTDSFGSRLKNVAGPRELGPWQYCLELQPARSMCKTAAPEPAAWWQHLVARVGSSQEMSISPAAYTDPVSIGKFWAIRHASLTLASIVFALLAGLLALLRSNQIAAFGIAALAVLELFAYAWSTRDTFHSPRPIRPK